MEPPIFCPFCKSVISANFFFCPVCGKKIKETAPSITLGKQINIYLLSIFAPPFGLIPGIKYMMAEDDRRKTVGLIAIILTIVSTVVTAWLTIGIFNQLNSFVGSQINSPLNKSIDQLPNLVR